MHIIDIHPHIISADTQRYPIAPQAGHRSVWSEHRPVDFEALVAEMAQAGVAKAAIVHSSTTYGHDNSYVADSVSGREGTFAGVYSIDVLAEDAVKTYDYWLGRGMAGIRLFTGGATRQTDGAWLIDPRSFPVWARAAELGQTIVIQTTPSGLPMVEVLLKRFPKVRIALDHCARPVLEGGKPYHQMQGLFDLARYDNLYLKLTPRTFDLAQAAPGGPEDFFPHLVKTFGADHLAFGSNYPASEGTLKGLITQGLATLAHLPQADQEWIWGKTAQVLYLTLKG